MVNFISNDHCCKLLFIMTVLKLILSPRRWTILQGKMHCGYGQNHDATAYMLAPECKVTYGHKIYCMILSTL